MDRPAMRQTTHWVAEDPEITANRQTTSLAALAVIMLLVVVGLYLVDVLRAAAAFQDCALSGAAC